MLISLLNCFSLPCFLQCIYKPCVSLVLFVSRCFLCVCVCVFGCSSVWCSQCFPCFGPVLVCLLYLTLLHLNHRLCLTRFPKMTQTACPNQIQSIKPSNNINGMWGVVQFLSKHSLKPCVFRPLVSVTSSYISVLLLLTPPFLHILKYWGSNTEFI